MEDYNRLPIQEGFYTDNLGIGFYHVKEVCPGRFVIKTLEYDYADLRNPGQLINLQMGGDKLVELIKSVEKSKHSSTNWLGIIR